jgi:hypothetical protein
MLLRPVLAAASALIVLAGTAGTSSAAPLHLPEHIGSASSRADVAHPAAAQKVYWKWSDESQKTLRLFREARYHRAAKLPRIVVTAVPAKPRRAVILQFQQKGKWLVETRTTTNAKGVATLKLDPYCTNRTWCDGTWTYRIKVGTLFQTLKVTYRGQ